MQGESEHVYHYRMYGLEIESALEIPELVPTEITEADVAIRFGDVAEHLPKSRQILPWLQVQGQSCLITVRGVGRFHICEGRDIVIDRRVDRQRAVGAGAPVSDVRLYVLGSAFGALLHQRGELPFHVSAVDSGDGVWAFTGPSGAGKSTTAGWFHKQRGWPILSDDVSVVRPTDHEPTLYPGPRKLKLWPDAIDYLGCQDDNLKRDLSNTDKYQLYLNDATVAVAAPLRALFVLERGEPDEPPLLQRLTGLDAFRACRQAVYRPVFERCFRQRDEYIADLVELAKGIEVFRFRRSWSLESMPEQFLELTDAFQSVAKHGAVE